MLQASLSFSGPQIIPKLMSRSTNIQQNSLRSGGSTSPGVGMRLIWQIVTGTVGEALKSGMVINVNPRRVPLSANSFTPYTQLRNLPKFSKGQVTGPIPFGPRVRGQICVNCVTTSAPHPLLFSSNINKTIPLNIFHARQALQMSYE